MKILKGWEKQACAIAVAVVLSPDGNQAKKVLSLSQFLSKNFLNSFLLNFSKKKAEFSVRGIVIEPAERAVGAAMKTTHEIPMRIEPM